MLAISSRRLRGLAPADSDPDTAASGAIVVGEEEKGALVDSVFSESCGTPP